MATDGSKTHGVTAIERVEGVSPPVGAYSTAVIYSNLVFLAGQGPFGADGQRVGTTITEQIDAALDNLERAARAAGSSMQLALRLGVFLNRIDDIDAVDERFRVRLGHPMPARTTIVTALPGFDVEIDAILALPSGH
jgi:2-iminobutanoate/2-iminopropanoate deaminase